MPLYIGCRRREADTMKHKSPVFSSALVTIREHPLLSAGLLFTIAGATILGILPPLVLETLINLSLIHI